MQPEPHTKSLRNKNKKKQIQQKETDLPKTARREDKRLKHRKSSEENSPRIPKDALHAWSFRQTLVFLCLVETLTELLPSKVLAAFLQPFLPGLIKPSS